MRVLHLAKYYPPYAGGMESFLADLLPALAAQEVETAALVHAHAGAERLQAPFPLWRAPTHGSLLYAPLSPAFPRWLGEMIDFFRPRLLHLHLPNVSAFWALALPAARRLPWVIHWHADVVPSRLDPRLRPAYRAYRPLERALLARAARIVATSPPYRDSSAALRPWRAKTEVIPLGLDPARLPPPTPAELAWARRQWGGEGLRLLCLGRLTYYKGHRVLLEALARTRGTLLVCAGGGELAGELGEHLRRLGLAGRVRLAGRVPDHRRNALVAACDVLVLPSLERTEAFGVVLLEAMAYGRPVIATHVPGSGMGWVVEEGQTGLLVPAGDAVALARAVGVMQQYPPMRTQMGEAGRIRLARRFHIRSAARRLAHLYGEVDAPA